MGFGFVFFFLFQVDTVCIEWQPLQQRRQGSGLELYGKFSPKTFLSRLLKKKRENLTCAEIERFLQYLLRKDQAVWDIISRRLLLVEEN